MLASLRRYATASYNVIFSFWPKNEVAKPAQIYWGHLENILLCSKSAHWQFLI